MAKKERTIRVFIASPGDLAVERRALKDVIDELNTGDGAKVKFEPLGWEDTLASTGRGSQSVVNREVDRADVFVLAMHRRWGWSGCGRRFAAPSRTTHRTVPA